MATDSILAFGTIKIPNANLLFKSSFENPIVFTDSNKEKLSGEDQGFDWKDISHLLNYFGGIVGDEVDTFLTTENSHDGTISLKQVVMKPWSGTAHRNELDYYTKHSDYSRLYIRKWIYYPSTMTLPSAGSLCAVCGHREVEPDFGVDLNVGFNGIEMYWFATGWWGEITPSGYLNHWIWWYNNFDVPVPLGRWFKIEEYIEFHPTDGVYKVWIDDVLTFDIRSEQTMNLEEETVHNRIGKIYVGHSSEDGYIYPYYHWLDDVEIWDGIPPHA